ncbi:MAG: glutathione S-transferase family protein [Myxococcales bacterium]|nr:glutathione S-transferase family protein [Myxococcales bacterium]
MSVARHLGIDHEHREVNVYRGEGRAPDFLALNPSGKIPALVDGDLVLTESNAIIGYLDEAYGGGRLGGDDARERAQVRRWLFWEAAHWQPALIDALAPAVGHLLLPALVPAPPVASTWRGPALLPLLGLLEEHLAGRSHLVGDRLTLADFGVAGMMTYAGRTGFPADAFPAIARWYAAVDALPAWRATACGPWA